jgi:hypothetical protein
MRDQGQQSPSCLVTGAIAADCLLETVKLCEFQKRTVDFPEQHRCAGDGAAEARNLAIDDDDLVTLPGQALSHQGTRDTGAYDQNLATKAGGDRLYRGWRQDRPRCTGTAQIVLFDIFVLEDETLPKISEAISLHTQAYVRTGRKADTAGALIGWPFGAKIEPWQGQSQQVSKLFQCRWQPIWVQLAE